MVREAHIPGRYEFALNGMIGRRLEEAIAHTEEEIAEELSEIGAWRNRSHLPTVQPTCQIRLHHILQCAFEGFLYGHGMPKEKQCVNHSSPYYRKACPGNREVRGCNRYMQSEFGV